MWRIWSETDRRLDSFANRVREGRDVMAASEFARWLFFSGIITLCKENSAPAPLKCDGALLQWKCEQLISQCGEYFTTNGQSAGLKETQLVSLHEKVDRLASNLELVAGHVSKLSPPAPGSEPPATVYTDRSGMGGGVAAAHAAPSLSKCHNSIETKENEEKPMKAPQDKIEHPAINGKGSYL